MWSWARLCKLVKRKILFPMLNTISCQYAQIKYQSDKSDKTQTTDWLNSIFSATHYRLQGKKVRAGGLCGQACSDQIIASLTLFTLSPPPAPGSPPGDLAGVASLPTEPTWSPQSPGVSAIIRVCSSCHFRTLGWRRRREKEKHCCKMEWRWNFRRSIFLLYKFVLF